MQKTKKQPIAPDHAEMQVQAVEQITAHEAKITQARARIQAHQSEIEQMRAAIEERSQQRQQIASQLDTAQQSVEQQEAYVSLLAGAGGSAQLIEYRATQQALQSRYAALQSDHEQEDEASKARIEKLQKMLPTDHAEIEQHRQAVSTLVAAREQLTQEHSQAVYEACAKWLTDLERKEREAKEAHSQAVSTLVAAKAESVAKMGKWPDLRRKLEAEHAMSSDATAEAMSVFLALLDTILRDPQAIEQAHAGIPSGTYSILAEMVIDSAIMRAVASGDCEQLRAQRERVAYLLLQYRRNLAVV